MAIINHQTMKKKSEKGQALIESIVAVMLIGSSVIVLVVLSHFLWIKMNLHFFARESLYCIYKSSNSEFFCKQKFAKQIQVLSKDLKYNVVMRRATKSLLFKGTHNGIQFSFKEQLEERKP